MQTLDDLNNCRIRRLIEQFNTEEAYDAELRSAIEEMRKLIASNADLTDLIAALRKWRLILRKRPPINATGVWAEN
ncbi:MAG TPA: hypothetical protein VGM66_05025 [Candidatus Udaeobacter sp.]|jgi:division protein CdvB (Snf7/Vps24/ESCRT-III family)